MCQLLQKVKYSLSLLGSHLLKGHFDRWHDKMMNLTNDILPEKDLEKRNLYWAHYIKQIQKNLRELKLSPSYKTLKFDAVTCSILSSNQKTLWMRTRKIERPDLRKSQWVFKSTLPESQLSELMHYAETVCLPTLNSRLKDYQDLKEFLYSTLTLEPIGVETLYRKEGFLLTKHKQNDEVYSYRYKLSNLIRADLRSQVSLIPVEQFRYKTGTNLVQYKKKLNKGQPIAFNCYLAEAHLEIPRDESLIPVSKGLLAKHLQET